MGGCFITIQFSLVTSLLYAQLKITARDCEDLGVSRSILLDYPRYGC